MLYFKQTWPHLNFYWHDVTWRGSHRNHCDIILDISLQKSGYVILFCEQTPSARLTESPSQIGHALVSSREFPLYCDLRGLFRISGWSASSSLSITWCLNNAESISGPFPNDVHYELPKNRGPPFLLLQCLFIYYLVLHAQCLFIYYLVLHAQCLFIYYLVLHAQCLFIYYLVLHAQCLFIYQLGQHVQCWFIHYLVLHAHCLFIYYLVLHAHCSCTLFIHVHAHCLFIHYLVLHI